jgi:pimeloyl-ACP methyl ester carboxylesterase
MRMAAGVGGAAQLLDRFEQLDVRAALADVAVPVLALHREHDRFVPSSNASYIAHHVAGARAVLLPGATASSGLATSTPSPPTSRRSSLTSLAPRAGRSGR